MNWLGKNYFKVGILIAVFIVLYFAYAAFVGPQIQKQTNISDCNAQGLSFSQQFQQNNRKENPQIISFVVPQYHYSKSRNTCLSENGYVFPDHGGTGTYMVITDLGSGKPVLQSAHNIYEVNSSTTIVSYDDFLKQAPTIMSN